METKVIYNSNCILDEINDKCFNQWIIPESLDENEKRPMAERSDILSSSRISTSDQNSRVSYGLFPMLYSELWT